MKNDDNIHAGHRERLTRTVYEAGFDVLSKYQQVEYMLFGVFPRGDMNPLAHRLLDHFGSLFSILEASLEDLMSVKGMGEMSAMKVKNLLPMFECYRLSKIENPLKSLKSLGSIYRELENLLTNIDYEQMILVSINKGHTGNGLRKYTIGEADRVVLDIRKVFNFVETYKSEKVIIAHNHPTAKCHPSANDLESYQKLKNNLDIFGVQIEDSLIYGTDGVFSMARNEKIKSY